jgi:hypothetical protein
METVHSGNNISEVLASHSDLTRSKVMKGRFGWLFLQDDTNSFLEYQFSLKKWSIEDISRVQDIFMKRAQLSKRHGASYHKFIVPEKSIVYQEFLPDDMSSPIFDMLHHENRPALKIEKIQNVVYLGDVLKRAKNYEQMYFKGDSHPNFVGSYVIYKRIIECLRETGFDIPLLDLDQLQVDQIFYNGDLYDQSGDEIQNLLKQENPIGSHSWGYELVKRINVDLARHDMMKVDPPSDYVRWFSRPTEVVKKNNSQLPKAVIFRDSTSQFLTDLLGFSFSSSTSIWHGGYVIEDIIERENPDIILHIQAERFLANLPLLMPSYKLCDIDSRT